PSAPFAAPAGPAAGSGVCVARSVRLATSICWIQARLGRTSAVLSTVAGLLSLVTAVASVRPGLPAVAADGARRDGSAVTREPPGTAAVAPPPLPLPGASGSWRTPGARVTAI